MFIGSNSDPITNTGGFQTTQIKSAIAKKNSKNRIKAKLKRKEAREKLDSEIEVFLKSLGLKDIDSKLKEVRSECEALENKISKSDRKKKQLRNKREHKALEYVNGRSKQRREAIAKANREAIDSRLSQEEKQLFLEITSFDLSTRLCLSDYFGIYLLEIIGALKISSKDTQDLIKNETDLFFSQFLKFSATFHAKQYALCRNSYSTESEVESEDDLESEFNKHLGSKEAFLKAMEDFKKEIYTLLKGSGGAKNLQNMEKLEKVHKLLVKLLSFNQGQEAFCTHFIGFLEGDSTESTEDFNSILNNLITYLKWKIYLSGFYQEDSKKVFNQFLTNFLKIQKKLTHGTSFKELKMEFLEISGKYKDLIVIASKIETTRIELALQMQTAQKEDSNPIPIEKHLEVIFSQIFSWNYSTCIETFEERLTTQAYPKFLSQRGYSERVISNLTQVKDLNPQPHQTNNNFGEQFAEWGVNVHNDIKGLFLKKQRILKENKHFKIALDDFCKEGGSEEMAIGLIIRNDLKAEIDDLPSLLQDIQHLHQKFLEKVKTIHAELNLSREKTEEFIKASREIVFESSLDLAQYLLVLTDSKIILNLEGDCNPLRNCEKYSTPQELTDLMALEGIEDLLLKYSPQESRIQESSSEQKTRNDKERAVIEMKWQQLSNLPSATPTKIHFPSDGTQFAAISRGCSSFKIARNDSRRIVLRALRALHFFARSGRGSHKVYSLNGRGSVAVPHDLSARGTQLSIQNSINELISS